MVYDYSTQMRIFTVFCSFMKFIVRLFDVCIYSRNGRLEGLEQSDSCSVTRSSNNSTLVRISRFYGGRISRQNPSIRDVHPLEKTETWFPGKEL